MGSDPVISHPDGAVIRVWVVPGASRTEIAGSRGDRVKVRVAVPPERGRANQEVAKVLTAILEADVELLAGGRSRGKSFLARGIGVEEAIGKLLA